MLKIRRNLRTDTFAFVPKAMDSNALLAVVNPSGVNKQKGLERLYSFHKSHDNLLIAFTEGDFVKDKSYDDPPDNIVTASGLVSFFKEQNPTIDINLSWVEEILRRERSFNSKTGTSFDSLLQKIEN